MNLFEGLSNINDNESLRESFTEGQFCIVAITNDGNRKFYKDGVFVDDCKSCTVFTDLDEARDVWHEIDKSGFKRVFVPNWSEDMFCESVSEKHLILAADQLKRGQVILSTEQNDWRDDGIATIKNVHIIDSKVELVVELDDGSIEEWILDADSKVKIKFPNGFTESINEAIDETTIKKIREILKSKKEFVPIYDYFGNLKKRQTLPLIYVNRGVNVTSIKACYPRKYFNEKDINKIYKTLKTEFKLFDIQFYKDSWIQGLHAYGFEIYIKIDNRNDDESISNESIMESKVIENAQTIIEQILQKTPSVEYRMEADASGLVIHFIEGNISTAIDNLKKYGCKVCNVGREFEGVIRIVELPVNEDPQLRINLINS